MSQIEKLKQLQAKTKQSSTMTRFDNIVVVNVGVEPKEHFPKLKNADGSNMKDENGKDLRSDKSDGYTYTFTEFGTAKVVKIVLPSRLNLVLLSAYQASGLGYDIKSAGMIFIEKDCKLANY